VENSENISHSEFLFSFTFVKINGIKIFIFFIFDCNKKFIFPNDFPNEKILKSKNLNKKTQKSDLEKNLHSRRLETCRKY